jgi:S-adenosylmethionine:tRNA ribosyltransferase-isomerase
LWTALARPAKRLKAGRTIRFSDNLSARVVDSLDGGRIALELKAQGELTDILQSIGRTPLPPYIKRDPSDEDRQRYQTVFASAVGAIAAPTAGLHFTTAILDQIRKRGVEVVEITLHVGYGTFEPVRTDDLTQHRVSPERYSIGESSAAALNQGKTNNGRIVAVGTTTTRALETNIGRFGRFQAETGIADLTVTPGYTFRAVDALLTNFHLPESSLLILVSTFGGRELIMEAYRHAVASRYRFYSYGDCMFVV